MRLKTVDNMKVIRPKGFTLLEIMVALAVAAIGLGAVSRAMTQNVDIAQQLEVRTVANWVASNRMAELRMLRQFKSGGSSRSQEDLAGRTWQIDEEYFSTNDPNLARVQITVYEDRDRERPAAVEVGFLGRYKPAVN